MAIFGKKKTEEKSKEEQKAAFQDGDAKKKEKKSASMKDLYKNEKSVKKEKKEKPEKKASASATRAYRVLVKPLITEKAANLGTESKYVFEVSQGANKVEIAKAINEVYGINPISVNIIKVGGKKVRYGRHYGKRRDWKKAIVSLPKGKTINIYEGV